jgi:deazaflavin-dependent oxidoreductase (nitroreductase family)
MLFGKEHVDRYLATDGEEGHDWRGTSTLILTTTGRRTGQPRDSALIYGRDGDAYLLVASRGGSDRHPLWYLNLVDNPTVLVQVKGDRFTAKARTATPEEKGRLWPIMTEQWPAYDEYQAKTDRDIPVVILDRV